MNNIRDAAEKVFDPQSTIGDLDQPKRYDGRQQFGAYQPVNMVAGMEYSQLNRGNVESDVPVRRKGT